MSDRDCPICSGRSSHEQVPQKDEFTHNCSRCGRFHITGLKSQTLPAEIGRDPSLMAKLQRYIAQRNSAGEVPKLDTIAIDEAINMP